MLYINLALLSEAAEESMSLGETMGRAGLNTLMGLSIVFLALAFIALIIKAEGAVFIKLDKMRASRKVVEKETVEENTETLAVDDEEEIAAVITAAIYAYEAETGMSVPAGGLVVRSIRRRR